MSGDKCPKHSGWGELTHSDCPECKSELAPAAGSGESQCATCGHKWPTGTNGEHSCTELLRNRVEKLEKASHELEARVKWALKFMKCQGSGMMVKRTADGGFAEGMHWTLWFADGLELLGRYKVDRELLGLSKKEQDKILKARASNHQNSPS